MTEQYKKQDIANSELYLKSVAKSVSVKQQLKKTIHAAISEAICCGITSMHIELVLKDTWEEYVAAYSEHIDDDEIPF
ncbi:hypothetical protein [Morganella morganii]|uniref:hypothetical protein n=1 Tax=Morganella morganii TaxID=582 RepID=UPI003D052B09